MITITESIALPGESPAAAPAAEKHPVARPRWFRRKRVTVPLAMLLLVALAGGYLGWRIYDSFTTINQVSTPPPVVSGIALGGDAESAGIDTAPAVAAVQTYEAAKQAAASADEPDPQDPANNVAVATATEPAPTATTEAPDQADAAITTGEPVTTDVAGQATDPTATTEPDPVTTTDQPMEPTTVPAGDEPDQVAAVAPTEEPQAATGEIEPVAAAPTTAPAGNTGNELQEEPELPETPVATEAPVLAEPTVVLPEYGEDSLDILLMGVDATTGESIDIGVRPDALAVLHLDRETGSCRMLAIPRDTRVELPGYGKSKINHALAVGGVPYQVQVVEQYLGVELDHYGLIDFGGVVTIVDKIGGVEVDNPAAFSSLGFDFPAGVQTLDGERALAYARFRGDAEGDFGRIGRQQEVLRAVMQKVSPGDLVGLIPEMLPLLQDHFRTDLSALDMADLATTYGQTCTYESLDTSTLEGETATHYDPLIELNLSYVIIDDAELLRKREWLLGE
jgi:LCP family protein required for cell wall assembly